MTRRLVVLGGSGASTPELAEAIAAWPGAAARRPALTLVLHGRSTGKLELVAAAFRARLGGAATTVAVEVSSDLDRALDGADAILIQVRIGGLAARTFDETFPHAFGIPGEETMGPGGTANAIRTVPALARVWEAIATRAPRALVVNLTNPSGIVVAVATRAFGLRPISVCDSPLDMASAIAGRLDRDLGTVIEHYVGCNHFGWWVPADEAELERVADLATGVDPEAVAIAGALPAPYDRYYLNAAPILAAQLATAPRAQQLVALEARQLAAYAAGAEGVAAAPRRGAVWYATAVLPVIDAWWNGGTAPLLLGLPTDGSVWGVPAGVIVERAYDVSGPDRHVALPLPALPAFPASVLARHAAYEALMAEALVTGASRGSLVRAMAANPMVRGMREAGELVDRIVADSPRG